MKIITDKFSGLQVSKQQRYVLRKRAAGLCIQCGRRKLKTVNYCRSCLKKRKGEKAK